MTKIAFIGGGNMARALIGGLLNSGTSAEQLLVAEPQAEAAASLRDDFGVVVDSDNDEIVAQADCLVLAVKPQVVKMVAQQMAPAVQAKKPLVVSIVAGIPMDSLDQWLGGGVSLVRTMPNTPALVGLGIAALFANKRASEQQRQLAEQILAAAGTTLWVENEVLLDAVTAVSGSGPAYFFRVMEAMIE
ncbi:MAG: pyrroline-5-carboxylate reductase, partial [Immundisolibacteraceae bacterium]|nr:pyrroline-5-carboxylate reductase [Immundisolibacteraceae bacterium]